MGKARVARVGRNSAAYSAFRVTPQPPLHSRHAAYVRADIPGGTFFFTVALLKRRRRLLVENIATLREAFRGVRHRYPFTIDAIVILPNHLHCVWTLPAADADFSTRWRLIKAAFARGIAAGERLSERRQRTGERGIWQRRFWEHAIRDAADLTRHVDYIHHNPVKHGHADRVVDWPYSSFHRYVERGVYPPDWAAGSAVRGVSFE